MNDKYYTPEIEDLHVGYICEIDEPVPDNTEAYMEWIEKKIDDQFNFQDYHNCERIRTKYLDIKDIESCGFTILENKPEFIKGFKQFKLKNYYNPKIFIKLEIDYNVISKMLSLSYDCGDFANAFVFEGECKSINELNYLLKLI